MAKKSLQKERIVYKPFEYPEAFDFYMKQQQAHWLWTEVPMMADVNDWKQNLSETEKNIIGSILKGFAQTETVVNDYWSTLVTKWFRKPEVIAMAVTFGCFETIHAEAYSLLNEELGLDDFAEFLEDETTMAKIENLMNVRDDHEGNPDWHERAKSLAIFSAFTEGVNLFSSFAVLLSFKLRNLLKGVGQIVEWSIRDELGDLEGCSKYDLVSFIKHRVNTKMGDLGYEPIVNGIDQEAVQRMSWFDSLSAGKQHTDFFANRVTNYSKGVQNWDAASLF
jgi:ribonucleoside-diphosphate reductase beta chain